MTSTAAPTDLDQRILAGYRASVTISELCLAEEVAHAVVRRVPCADITLGFRWSALATC